MNEERLNRIEERLKHIETVFAQYLKPAPAVTPKPEPAAPSGTPQTPTSYTKWSAQGAVVAQPPAKDSTGNFLGLIGVICFVLAAAFIVKLAIDSGWLTPARQMGLAALFGLSLIASGFWLYEKDKDYAAYLPGAGIIVLYFCVYAAYSWHGLITDEVALGGSTLVSILCIWIYSRLRRDIYALTAAAGSYLSPLQLGDTSATTFSLYYFVACSTAFAVLASWVSSRNLAIVASYLAIGVTTYVGSGIGDDLTMIVFLAIQFLVFALGTVGHSLLNRKPLSAHEAWSFFPVLLFFYGTEYYFINRWWPEAAPWISLGFAGLLIGLYFVAKKALADVQLASTQVIVAFATTAAFHSGYLELVPDVALPWIFVAILFAFALPFALNAKLRGALDHSSAPHLKFPIFALGAIALIEYIKLCFYLIDRWDANFLSASVAALFGLHFLYSNFKSRSRFLPNESILFAAHTIAVLAIYRLLSETGSFAVSAGWLAYAVANIFVGYERRDIVFSRSALGILGLAAIKALLYDASQAPTLVRIACLLLTGTVLYGCGFWLRKISTWQTSEERAR